MAKREWVINTLPLVYDENCKVLILGTFPGKQSRKYGFYYCDFGNRFWEVMEEIFHDTVPWCLCERRDYLLKHHIALWDLCACCSIEGSGDDTISDVVPNAICCLLEHFKNIKAVFFNGSGVRDVLSKNSQLDQQCKDCRIKRPDVAFIELPSTSGQNGKWNEYKHNEEWKKVADFIEGRFIAIEPDMGLLGKDDKCIKERKESPSITVRMD